MALNVGTRIAQVLAALNHPNIAAIYGFEDGPTKVGPYADNVGAELARPVCALVLELVEGETLADRNPVAQAHGIARRVANGVLVDVREHEGRATG
jgi:serine/threonine protein kinase